MPITRHSRRDSGDLVAAESPGRERVYEALTDLSAYALRFDIECHRLDGRLVELASCGSSPAERRALLRERARMEEEGKALRRAIAAFRTAALSAQHDDV